VGDPAVLRERERDGYLGGEVTVDLDDGAIRYTVDDQQYIEVLEVAPLSPEETPPRIDAE